MNADRRRQQYTQAGKGKGRMRDCNCRGQKYKSNKHVMPVNPGITFSRTIPSPCQDLLYFSSDKMSTRGSYALSLSFKADGLHGASWHTMTPCKLDVGKLAICSPVQNTIFSVRTSHITATGAAQKKAKGEDGEDSCFGMIQHKLQGEIWWISVGEECMSVNATEWWERCFPGCDLFKNKTNLEIKMCFLDNFETEPFLF